MWDINNIQHNTHLLILYVSVILMDAKKVVELGTGRGWATEVFSDALGEKGRIYTVELFPEKEEVLTTKEKLKDRENVTFIAGDSVEIGKRWDDEVDIVFVDSEHDYQHVFNELKTWWTKTKILFVHDIFDPSSRDRAIKDPPYFACTDFCNQEKLKFTVFRSYLCPEGIGVIKIK